MDNVPTLAPDAPGLLLANTREAKRGPAFNIAVPPSGYVWWYLDALSADGRYGLTCIVFVGSVFSPYYARDRAHPAEHSSLNLALYGPDHRRWAMTERPEASLDRQTDCYRLARSRVEWQGDSLVYEVDEWATPLPYRVKGRITVTPRVQPQRAFQIDSSGRHIWQPVAPVCDVSVQMQAPKLSWTGTGYLDSNRGTEPLEAGFQSWHWSRMHTKPAVLATHVDPDTLDTLVCYDAVERAPSTNGEDKGQPISGLRRALFLRLCSDGRVVSLQPAKPLALEETFWRVNRVGHSDTGLPGSAKVVRTFEDTPFYARSQIETSLDGTRANGFHESLDLDRFSAPWVQFLLPFRMPRRAG